MAFRDMAFHAVKPVRIRIRAMRYLCAMLALFAFFAGFLFLMQDRMILLPNLAAAAGIPPADATAVEWIERGHYRGLVYTPDTPVRGTVVIFHGNASLAGHLAELTPPFLERGLRVVLQEYPGFAQRPGKAGVRDALACAHEDVALVHEKWPGPVYLAGHSFGAGMAAQVAAARPNRIAGVLLLTPWHSLAALAREKYFGIPLDILLHERLDSAQALKSYPGPIVIVAAGRDTIVPPHHARALADALPNARHIELHDADHVSWLYTPMPDTYARIFDAWGVGL